MAWRGLYRGKEGGLRVLVTTKVNQLPNILDTPKNQAKGQVLLLDLCGSPVESDPSKLSTSRLPRQTGDTPE